MFDLNKERKLFDEFNAACRDLDNYDKIDTLIRRKIEATLKVLSSKAFKQSIYLWGINKPKELIAVYNACKSEDGFILTYGETVINGLYLDFCQSFKEVINRDYFSTYSIKDAKTSETMSVKLKEIAEFYSNINLQLFNIELTINTDFNTVTFPLVVNEFVLSNGSVQYGFIRVEPLIKESLAKTIEEYFFIEKGYVKEIHTSITKENLDKNENNIENNNEDKKVIQLFDSIG